MTEIIPAIMPQSFEHLGSGLELVRKYVPLAQIDIMDGVFVRGKTWPYINDRGEYDELLAEADGLPFWQELDFEIDLMVAHPEDVVEAWMNAGARRIVVHVESTPKMKEIIALFNERFAYTPPGERRDIELGIALNIATPTEKITEYLEDADFIQFMGIDTIGYQGQAFDERVLDKIRDFHNNHPEVIISVDGGVGLATAPALIEAGAKRLVSGSAILESDNPKRAIETFKNL